MHAAQRHEPLVLLACPWLCDGGDESRTEERDAQAGATHGPRAPPRLQSVGKIELAAHIAVRLAPLAVAPEAIILLEMVGTLRGTCGEGGQDAGKR